MPRPAREPCPPSTHTAACQSGRRVCATESVHRKAPPKWGHRFSPILREVGYRSRIQIREAAEKSCSLPLGRTPFHSDRDHGLIIESLDIGRVVGNCLEY